MRAMRSGLAGLLLVAGVLGLTGCGGNPNEREFLDKAPPGKPSDDPLDKNVAHRRDRTRNVSKQVQKIEERNQGASKKAPSP